MARSYTPEQQAALDATGKTIVSASAGSGKTTVMIEKIIRYIQNDCDVSQILAVTFTKKAASQMKEKLSGALIKTINKKETTPKQRQRLKEQLSEVPNADISTIHSFCSKLIRSHFFMAGVDNAFRVIGGDDAEGTALKNAALDELLEEGYEEKDPAFMSLLAVYWRKKSDKALRKIFTTAYENLRARADYRAYLEKTMTYTAETFEGICQDLLKILQEKCQYYRELVEKEAEYFEGVKRERAITQCQEICDGLSEILAEEDYFKACEHQKPAYTVVRKINADSEETAKHIKRLAFLREKIAAIYTDELAVTQTKDEELQQFLRSGETAAALAKYLLLFDDKYAALKAERGVLDYNDLEHIALQLLKNPEVAAEMKEKYRYVFVDEYQDVNPVQEEIISLLSGEQLFLVGDVKQSIYGFRGSKSIFFVEKQREFATNGGNNLAMTRNFRSTDQVLDAVNSQFALAMTLQTSNVDYAADSRMERGGMYALNSGKVAIHFLGKEEKKAPQKRGVYSVKEKSAQRETEESRIAKLIQSIVDGERCSMIYDPEIEAEKEEDKYRQVRYSDIAVLSRKKQGQIAKTVAALAAAGVPVTAAAAVNVCDYAEVKTLIDILSLIDNAEQDVPLCSALLSAMGDLTADDLTEIRLAYPTEEFFRKACRLYATEQTDLIAHKLQKFDEKYKKFRLRSQVLGAGELLTEILSETKMESRLLAQENGEACLRRIRRFIEESISPESLCVHEFLDRLRDLEYEIECNENGGEESVKVLTMHSSKGLEYPIVILDNLSASFRGADRDDVFVEEKYGLAPRAYDTEKMTKRDTLLRRLHESRELDSATQDELNLYYVALTRAKHTLHMIFDERTPMPNARYARSFAEFTDFDVWEQYVVTDEIFDPPKQDVLPIVFRPSAQLTQEIMQAFLWEYPFHGYEDLPVKSSATALLANAEMGVQDDGAQVEDEENERDVEADELEEGKACEEREQRIAMGLAYHAFLESFNFALLYDEQGRKVSQDALREIVEGHYTRFAQEKAEDAALVTVDKLTEILLNKVFYQLSDARLYKEQQFLVALPVAETYAKKADLAQPLPTRDDGEEMIFQGAIDLLAVFGDSARIIDYKFSRMGADYLREHYAPQLQLYRLAVAKILKIPVEKIRCTIVNIDRGFQVDLE